MYRVVSNRWLDLERDFEAEVVSAEIINTNILGLFLGVVVYLRTNDDRPSWCPGTACAFVSMVSE